MQEQINIIIHLTIPDWNNLCIEDLANCDLKSIYLLLVNYVQSQVQPVLII